MKSDALSPQYIVDHSGQKRFVVLKIEEYEELMEDLHDLAIMAERRDDERLSIEEFEEDLKRDGLLQT